MTYFVFFLIFIVSTVTFLNFITKKVTIVQNLACLTDINISGIMKYIWS